ncbi:hypothetical protein [Streptomyces sp. CBMA123]|uniref:hypothetical protein n=1 Tax=Streptomyces sp. CBMA123 TaxID=1896313 RepID=UPI0016618F3E|nr:hypothetical protein [Streptomyces sp. CBMA123]MBD0692958.1 hypothetical protein [Streptomyces sp. CBMA123]
MPVRSWRAAVAAAAVLLFLPAPRAAAEPAAYTLRNARTGTCLHHAFGTAQVRLEPCEEVPEQRWELRAAGAWTNVTAFDREKGTWGCMAIGDNWSIRYGQCGTTESAWTIPDGGRSRVRSESDLNGNDLYLTETQDGRLSAQPGGTTPSADWIVAAEIPGSA